MWRLGRNFILAYIILTTIFLVALTLAFWIPSSMLSKNIGRSLTTLKSEGTYPSVGLLSWRKIALDNFTDTNMLNIAYSADSRTPFKSAVMNVFYEDPVNNIDQIHNLEKLYQKKEVKKVAYERYWQGYQIYLRPLLVFFDYSFIRYILTFLLFAGVIIFTWLSWKKLGVTLTASFVLGLIAVDFFYIGHSMHFSGVFLVGIFSSIYLLLTYKKNDNLSVLFFIVGGLSVFFDVLSTPLVPLGFLLIVAYGLGKKNIKQIFWLCFCWSAGFALLWATKWILAGLLFSPTAITSALNEVVARTTHKVDDNFSRFNTLKLNLYQLRGYDKTNKIILLVLSIISAALYIKYFSFSREKLNKIIPLVFIAILPYVWYAIAANHAYLHVWFVYRDQFMSVVCFFLIIAEFIDKNRLKKDLRRFKLKAS